MGCGSSSKRGAEAQVAAKATARAEERDAVPQAWGDEATKEGGPADAAGPDSTEQFALIPQIVKKVAVIRNQAEQYRGQVQQEIISIEQGVLEELKGGNMAGVENGVVTASYSPGEEAAGTGVIEGLEGEALEIIVKDAGGWAYCRKQGHDAPGWLPSTRVAELAALKADHQSQTGQEQNGLLSLRKGDMVEVINRHYSGWTFCREWTGPPLPGVPSERKEGWVTDTYLEDRRSQAMLASKWHRLVLQALDQVVASGRELELFLGQAQSYMDDVKGPIDSHDEWLVKCLEFAAWLSTELQSITAAVRQHEKAFVVVQGCKAVAKRSCQSDVAHQLGYEEGDRFTVVDAKHSDWIWCRLDGGTKSEGWVLRSNLVFEEQEEEEEEEPSESDSSEASPSIGHAQDAPGQALGLPAWVRAGERCRWWSSSSNRHCGVIVQSVDAGKREVRVVFLSDESYWKVIGFDHFDLPRSEWLLVPEEEKARELRDQLPEWVAEGGAASWWSVSQKRCMPVQIFEVNFKRRMVGASFKQDPGVKKFVPFHQLIDDPESCFLQKDSAGHRHRRRSSTHGSAGAGGGAEFARAESAPDRPASRADLTDSGQPDDFPESQVGEGDTMMRQTMGQLLKTMQQDLGDMLGPGELAGAAVAAEAPGDLDLGFAAPLGEPPSALSAAEAPDASPSSPRSGRAGLGPAAPLGDAADEPVGAPSEGELALTVGTPMGQLLKEMQQDLGDAQAPDFGAAAADAARPVPRAVADAAADAPGGAPPAQAAGGGGARGQQGSEELPPETPGQLLREMERDFGDMLGQGARDGGEADGGGAAEPGPAAPAGAATDEPGDATGQAAASGQPAAAPPRGEGPPPRQDALQAALGLMEKAPQPLDDGGQPEALPGGSAVADPVDDAVALHAAAAADGGAPLAGAAFADVAAEDTSGGGGSRPLPPLVRADSPDTVAAPRQSEVMGQDSPVTESTLGQAERELEQLTEASIDVSACAEGAGGGRNTRSTPGGMSIMEEEASVDGSPVPPGRPRDVGYSRSEHNLLEGIVQSGQPLGKTLSLEEAVEGETSVDGPIPPGPRRDMGYSRSEHNILEGIMQSSQSMGKTLSLEFHNSVQQLLEEPPATPAPAPAAGPPRAANERRAAAGGGGAAAGEGAAKARQRDSGGSKESVAAAPEEEELVRMQSQSDLLRQAVSLIQPSTWDADPGGELAIPDPAQLAMEWSRLEEELAMATEAENQRAAAGAELKLQARVRTLDSQLADLQGKLEERAQAAEQKLHPQEAQRFRTMSWEVVQMAEAARDKRAKNKEALLALRPQKAARRREALREALDMDDFGGDGGGEGPQMPTLGRAALADLSLADAIGEAAELAGGIFRTLQVSAKSRRRRRPQNRRKVSKVPTEGWASGSPTFQQQAQFQDPSQRELRGKCQAAIDSFDATLDALLWRLEQEQGQVAAAGASKELLVVARGEEGLSREQKREKAMFEGQQDYDWERSHEIHIRERAERQERAFASALARTEEQLRGEWQGWHERERARSLERMGRLSERLRSAEAEIDDLEQQQRQQLEEESGKLEADRRRIHEQMQVLVAAAAVIRQVKGRMDEVYYADKSEKQEVSIRCLRKVRRLNRDLKDFAHEVLQEVKQQHSVLLYSLRMLEARLLKECPNADDKIEDGDLETAEVKKQREEADQAFEDQLARDLQSLRESHLQRTQRMVRNVAARHRTEVEREELADSLPAARQALEESLREGALVDLAVAALRPFAKAAALLEVESFRHAEVDDSAFEPASFGPKPKRLAAATKATSAALRAALASAGEARGALSGEGLPPARQDGEWSEKVTEAERRWQAFLEAHPEAEGYAADGGCDTPRCRDSLAADSTMQVLELDVDDLDEDPDAGGVAGPLSQGGARAGRRGQRGPPSPGPSPRASSKRSAVSPRPDRASRLDGSPRPDRPGRATKGAGRPQKAGVAAGPGAPKGGPPAKSPGRLTTGPPGQQRAPPGGGGAAKPKGKATGATELLAQLDDLSKTMDLALGGASGALERTRSKTAAPPPPRKAFAADSAAQPPPGRGRPPPS